MSLFARPSLDLTAPRRINARERIQSCESVDLLRIPGQDLAPATWTIVASKKVDDLARHESKHDDDPKHDPKAAPKRNPREKEVDPNLPIANPAQKVGVLPTAWEILAVKKMESLFRASATETKATPKASLKPNAREKMIDA